MIDILNTYPNLANVRNKLTEIICKNRLDQSIRYGLEIVEHFLKPYDGQKVSENQKIFSELDNYDCETPVIKSYWAGEARTSIKDYLIHATHHLWLELSGNTPWTLKTYSASEIDALFRINRMAEAEGRDSSIGQARGNYSIQGLDPQLYDSETYVHHLENDAFLKLFPFAKKFIHAEQQKAIEDVLR